MGELQWTKEQNETVKLLIADEVEKARLSHNFILATKPPLPEDARNVRGVKYDSVENTVADFENIPLVEVSAPVILTSAQAADKEDLSSALLLIRRAANRLARAHDEIIFCGQPNPDDLPPKAKALKLTAKWGSRNGGLCEAKEVDVRPAGGETPGEALVGKVAEALVELEDAGYIGSYVLILGQDLFTHANTPSKGSMVLPSDRIKNLLELEQDQHVYRSSVLEPRTGLLLSLGGEPMDRAVAINPKFEFLRTFDKEQTLCRVFERFALRLKEKGCVVKLTWK